MAKRSFKTLQGTEEDGSETEQQSELEEEETESEDEAEQREERRVMIRVVPRERFESSSFIHYSAHSASCSGSGGGGGANVLCCQVDGCGADLKDAKQYHRRHKVCQRHAKSAFVLFKGMRQRFCQQCSRFHETSEFDGMKRSCRDRLAGHNERRRKAQSDQQAEEVIKSSPSMVRIKAVRHPKHRERELTLQSGTNTQHFPII
ncbi:hypothetical protein PTKIN_Ptkin07bG0311700 [Pterospermum kingtungense]